MNFTSFKSLSIFRPAAMGSLLLGAAATCQAALVLDTYSGGGSYSSRSAESSPGSQISVSTTTTISQIAVLVDLAAAGNVKFLIFDHADESLQYISGSQAFADDGATWKLSDAMSFTLVAGKTYDIGAIADVEGFWSYDQISESQNGFTTTPTNPNFAGFAAPTETFHAGADAAVRLYSDIPEPSVMVISGVLALGSIGYRRRRG